MNENTITLGGRRFKTAVHTTLRQDQWLQKRIAATGVYTLTKRADESALEYAQRITTAVVESGLALEIVAGLLLPADQPEAAPWSESQALAIAEHLGNLTDPAEKRAFNSELAGLVAGFFAVGLRSSMTSLRSSDPAVREPQPSQTSHAEH